MSSPAFSMYSVGSTRLMCRFCLAHASRLRTRVALLLARVASLHHRMHAAAGGELAFHYRPLRLAGARHVIQNPVHGVFVKDPEVAIGEQIVLQRLQFYAELGGQVMDGNGAEIRESGARAD